MINLSYGLKRIREDLGMTQEEFAKFIGVKRSTLSLWESANRTPKMEKISKICDKCQCSYEYLLGEGERKIRAKDKPRELLSTQVYYCSNCGESFASKVNFCNRCGAVFEVNG